MRRISCERFMLLAMALLKAQNADPTPNDQKELRDLFSVLGADGDFVSEMNAGELAGGLAGFFQGNAAERICAVYDLLNIDQAAGLPKEALREFLRPYVGAMVPHRAEVLRPLFLKKISDDLFEELSCNRSDYVSLKELQDWMRVQVGGSNRRSCNSSSITASYANAIVERASALIDGAVCRNCTKTTPTRPPRGCGRGSVSEAKRCMPLAQRQPQTHQMSQTLPAHLPLTPPGQQKQQQQQQRQQQQQQQQQQHTLSQQQVPSKSNLRSPRITAWEDQQKDQQAQPSPQAQPSTPISRATGRSTGVLIWPKATPLQGSKNDAGSISASCARLSDSSRRRISVPGHIGSPRAGGSIAYVGDSTPGAPPPMVATACHSPRKLSQQPSVRARSPFGVLPLHCSAVAQPVRRSSSPVGRQVRRSNSPVGRQVTVLNGTTAYNNRHGCSSARVLSPHNTLGVLSPRNTLGVRGTSSPMVPQGTTTPMAPLGSPRLRSSSPPSRSQMRMNPPGPLVVPPTAQLPGLAVSGPMAGETDETTVAGCTSSAVTYSL